MELITYNDNVAINAGISLWMRHGDIPADVNLLADVLKLQLEFDNLYKSNRAMLIKLPSVNKIICAANISPERQRYAIAHELAHELIHQNVFTPHKSRQERACQVCAASMLMPPPRLEEDAKKLDGKKSIVYDLSNKYFVSRQAMRIQLQRLGFNTDVPAIPERQVEPEPVIYNGIAITRPDLEIIHGRQLGMWGGKPLYRIDADAIYKKAR
jgi:Zn-dependent peptidase ImmA (M78 family)